MLNKVRIFSWRVCKNGLPTKTLPRCHSLVHDGICPFCKFTSEDEIHALFTCSHLRPSWASLMPRVTFLVWVDEAQSQVNKLRNDLERLFMIAWDIWKWRNL